VGRSQLRQAIVKMVGRYVGPNLSGDVGDGVEIGAALPWGLRAAPSITFFNCGRHYTLVSDFSGTICFISSFTAI
jgi:hypothetical protein